MNCQLVLAKELLPFIVPLLLGAPQVSANGTAAAKSGVLGSFVNRLSMRVVGKESLSSEDLAPALEDMKRRLMERNVAEEIAVQVCNSVAQSLEGKKLSSFTGEAFFFF
jgi:signal recognition particle receptor subunit alpha